MQLSQGLTLYPEDLIWMPLLVSVDFIRMKKERSRVLSGDRRLGLLDSTAGTNTQTTFLSVYITKPIHNSQKDPAEEKITNCLSAITSH